ncbi:hypothetical protein [Agrobacterium vitis]|uniref:hypothetical protein n=1 Tax=Agrobacterium vitis TaxID=373 RepID=UPI000872E464|nr:hypothetical protein [Agrobacterium vitis]MCE6073663.1 hypothetical protein [Agrobacterium vitis]MCM2452225.1 hypothetical protein [Agrobacterium vitis]MCM2469596.1 hypothetical protein [Agrobacterium vitis]MUO68933.1 hypothetical protein [Agrobacterium vitis]MUO84740.1 hypothetical protein [Agrobacterium vitis]
MTHFTIDDCGGGMMNTSLRGPTEPDLSSAMVDLDAQHAVEGYVRWRREWECCHVERRRK